MTLILHHAPQSRSTRMLWLLEELGADYRIDYVDIQRHAGAGAADPRNPHPMKQAPAITTEEGVVLIESVLLLVYLTDRYPDSNMAPSVGDPRRAEYLAWLGLYNNVLELVLTAGGPDSWNDLQKAGYVELDRRWRAALEDGGFIMGAFGALDILFGSLLQWFRAAMPAGEPYDAYVARIQQRPALARAWARDARPDAAR